MLQFRRGTTNREGVCLHHTDGNQYMLRHHSHSRDRHHSQSGEQTFHQTGYPVDGKALLDAQMSLVLLL